MARSTRKGGTRLTARKAYTGLSKRRRGTSPAFKKLEARKMALESRYRRLREKTKDKGGPAMGAALTTSGGAIGGAINASTWPTIAGVPTSLIIGVGGTVFGIYSDMKFSSQIAAVSTGVLAKFAGDWSESVMQGGELNPLATIGSAE